MSPLTPAGPPPSRWYTPVRTLRNVRAMLSDTIGFVAGRFERYGDVYRVDEGGGRSLYITRHPDHFRDLFVRNAKHFGKRGGANDRLLPILGDGLLTAEGEVWKQARRTLQPHFHRTLVQGYAEAMRRHADAISWKDGEELDLSSAMMRLTLDIVCDTLFDHRNTGSDTHTVSDTMTALQDSTGSVLPSWLPSPARRRGRAALARLHAHIDALCEARIREGARADMISMLLEVGLERAQIRDQLVTFFLAGHETTSHALTWTWWLLATHPPAEARLHAELDAVLEPGQAPGPEHALPWLDAVLAEALRLYPPAYAIPRVAVHETHLGEVPIHRGDQVVAWIWHAHRDARWFEAPDDFRPERFISPSHPTHAYLPFGMGARMCIGSAFAKMELRILLAMLARRYRLVPPPGVRVQPRPRVTLVPSVKDHTGVPMRVQARP